MRSRVLPSALLCATLAACAVPQAPRPAADTPPPPPTRPARTPPDKVARLIGLAPEGVTAALGAPVLTRGERGGEAWLYAHANGCSIEVVLYPATGPRKVIHATTQTPKGMEESVCLKAIAEASP